jgi:hypothetical protein
MRWTLALMVRALSATTTTTPCPTAPPVNTSDYDIVAATLADGLPPRFFGAPTFNLYAGSTQALLLNDTGNSIAATVHVRLIATSVAIGCGCGGATAASVTSGGDVVPLFDSSGSPSMLRVAAPLT